MRACRKVDTPPCRLGLLGDDGTRASSARSRRRRMDLSVSSAGGRREERMPLDVLVELKSEWGDTLLEADGLDLSASGIAIRAAFVPPLGARLSCEFRCPPEGERVRAAGEVAWAEQSGPR